MPFEMQEDAGTYVLLLYVKTQLRLEVGALGVVTFLEGFYLYVGKAKKHLRKRVERHFAKEKQCRWHIDYLTSSHLVDVIAAFILPLEASECVTVRELARSWRAPLVKGFGNSDCPATCDSHLLYLGLREKVLSQCQAKMTKSCLSEAAEKS